MRMRGESIESFVKAGGSALEQKGSDFGGEYADTTRVFKNPDDSSEVYHEVMEPGNIGPGFSSAPLPFYSKAWATIMDRFANELPPEILKTIDDAYKAELAKAEEGFREQQSQLGDDYDMFNIMGENSVKDDLRRKRSQAIDDAVEAQQAESDRIGKEKADKQLAKKSKSKDDADLT